MNRRALLGLIALAFTTPAMAHRTRSGAQYLPECCDNRDCDAIADKYVHELGNGHVIMRIQPGSHPMWRAHEQSTLAVEFGPEHRRPPLDGDWHVCIGPTQRPLCYHPPKRGF